MVLSFLPQGLGLASWSSVCDIHNAICIHHGHILPLGLPLSPSKTSDSTFEKPKEENKKQRQGKEPSSSRGQTPVFRRHNSQKSYHSNPLRVNLCQFHGTLCACLLLGEYCVRNGGWVHSDEEENVDESSSTRDLPKESEAAWLVTPMQTFILAAGIVVLAFTKYWAQCLFIGHVVLWWQSKSWWNERRMTFYCSSCVLFVCVSEWVSMDTKRVGCSFRENRCKPFFPFPRRTRFPSIQMMWTCCGCMCIWVWPGPLDVSLSVGSLSTNQETVPFPDNISAKHLFCCVEFPLWPSGPLKATTEWCSLCGYMGHF